MMCEVLRLKEGWRIAKLAKRCITQSLAATGGREVVLGSKMGTRGRGDVGARDQGLCNEPFGSLLLVWSAEWDALDNVPTSPHPPLYLRVGLAYDAHAVAPAKQLNLRPVAHGHDIHPMALVCSNIEALSQNTADPAIRDRPFILEPISFDEYCHDVGHGNYGTL